MAISRTITVPMTLLIQVDGKPSQKIGESSYVCELTGAEGKENLIFSPSGVRDSVREMLLAALAKLDEA